jgi:hypothetical protein
MRFRVGILFGLTVAIAVVVIGCIVIVVQSDTGVERRQTEPPRM